MEESTQNRIESLRTAAAELLADVSGLLQANRSGLEFLTLCAGVTIQFLEFSEKITRTDFSPAEGLVWHDIAVTATQIAYHTLELQSADEASAAMHLSMIRRHADHIRDAVHLPDPTCNVPFAIPETGTEQDPGRRNGPAGSLTVYTDEDTEARLRREIKELREKLVSLVMEKEELENAVMHRLSAEYTLKIGVLLYEYYGLKAELRRIQRKITLAKDFIARERKKKEQPVNTDIPQEVEERIEEEFKSYRKKLDEYIKSKQEAEDYLRKHPKKDSAGNTEDETGGMPALLRSAAGKDSGDESNSSEENTSSGTGETKQEEPPVKDASYMKKVYRKIVKAMHPDLHPDQSEQEKELFRRAIIAYEDGDLETLDKIYAMIENVPSDDNSSESTIEKLIHEKQTLLLMIRQMQESIRKIQSRFPFTERELLSDPDKLAAKQDEIRRKIDEVKRQIDEYTKYYETMLRDYLKESENQNG